LKGALWIVGMTISLTGRKKISDWSTVDGP
jgi:hypothetical protein